MPKSALSVKQNWARQGRNAKTSTLALGLTMSDPEKLHIVSGNWPAVVTRAGGRKRPSSDDRGTTITRSPTSAPIRPVATVAQLPETSTVEIAVLPRAASVLEKSTSVKERFATSAPAIALLATSAPPTA